jgi:hypothetical protein
MSSIIPYAIPVAQNTLQRNRGQPRIKINNNNACLLTGRWHRGYRIRIEWDLRVCGCDRQWQLYENRKIGTIVSDRLPRVSTTQAKIHTITDHEDSCEETKEKDSGGKDRASRELPDERGTKEDVRNVFSRIEKITLHEDGTDTLHGLVETGEDTDLAKGVGSLEAVSG